MMLSFLQEKVTIAIERKRNTIKKTLQFYERERKKWYEIMYTWSDKKEENFLFICSTTWKFITYLYLSPHQTKDHTFCQYLLWNIAIHNLYYRLVCARHNERKRERTRMFARAWLYLHISVIHILNGHNSKPFVISHWTMVPSICASSCQILS